MSDWDEAVKDSMEAGRELTAASGRLHREGLYPCREIDESCYEETRRVTDALRAMYEMKEIEPVPFPEPEDPKHIVLSKLAVALEILRDRLLEDQ